MQKSGKAQQFADSDLKNNFDLVKIAVKQNVAAIKYASEDLQDNFEIMQIAINEDKNKNIDVLAYAGERCKDNFELVKSAIIKNRNNILYASKRLQKNLEIIQLVQEVGPGDGFKMTANPLKRLKLLSVVSKSTISNGDF